MATIKISNLNQIAPLNPNTGNVSFVTTDTQSGISGRITATTLANGLFANNVLNVGNTQISFPNVVAQFAKAGESYIQVNLLNTANGGSADYVATAESGTDTTYFIDTGYANKNFIPGFEYNSLGDSIHALDGYLYVQGNSSAVNVGGNLVIGTTTTGSHVRFIVGGGTKENVVTEFGQTYIGVNRTLVFGDGTTQNTSFVGASVAANTPSNVANSAALYANGAFIAANTPSNVANSAALYANGAFLAANSAFNKANNALANTTGTFAGTLTITNDLNTSGIVTIANSGFSATQSAVTISASNTGVSQTPATDGYMLHVTGKHNVSTRIISDSFGANGQLVFPSYVGRAARGNVTNPSAVQTNDVLVRFAGSSYGTTGYQVGGTARIDIVASENHTDAARGTTIKFYNVQTGTNTITNIAAFNANDVTFTGTVNPAKGFIFSPNVQSTLTTIGLDFSRDCLVKFNVNDDATITLSNYVAGKVIELWITNSAAQNKTITHGCLANNSTAKSTTFTITASSSAYLRYFSIDGDQANTFVTITA